MLSVYFIGNSVTDGINYNNFRTLVLGQGHTYSWGRHMIPGAPLQWIWDHPADGLTEPAYPTALADMEWTTLSLQPFDRNLATDLDYATRFINLAKPRSPNLQVYIYARYPRQTNMSGDFAAAWNAASTNQESRAFFETLTMNIRNAHPDIKPVLMVPVGHVMYDLHQQMVAGNIPGYGHIFDLYADGIHMTSEGSYLVAVTFYATLFKRDPAGFPTAPWTVNATLAAKIQETVWRVVRGLTQYTGVE